MTKLNILGTTNYSRTATKIAFIIAALFTTIGFAKFAFGFNTIGIVHIMKYTILFLGLYIGTNQLIKSNDLKSQDDVILFGIKVSLRTTLIYTLMSSLFVVIFQSAGNMDFILNGSTIEIFMINILVTFWGCLIIGVILSYLVSVLIPTNNK